MTRLTQLTTTLTAGTALLCASSAMAVPETVTFGSDNDGLGGFSHTNIGLEEGDPPATTTFLTEQAGSVQYRNQNTNVVDAGFIKQYSIDRTADSGLIYTVTGTFTVSDGYADDNNRLGLVLFTDPTTVLSRNNAGQIGIVWNTDDSSAGGSPGNDASDNLAIMNGFNNTGTNSIGTATVLRDQTIPYAQDLLQGTQITMSATFWFTGTDINIQASMTDAGGVTNTGTATVLAADFVGDYFGFISVYRARNYDGTPDPAGTARDNPLVQDYESFSFNVVPEPASLALMGLGGLMVLGRRRRAGC